MIKENSKNNDLKVWWFLDDVFNEFDKYREKTVFESILKKADFYLATSAKKPDFGNNNLTLKNLTN
jgi:recombinational DNA repair ATPase RecF